MRQSKPELLNLAAANASKLIRDQTSTKYLLASESPQVIFHESPMFQIHTQAQEVNMTP